jgi:hypothetical protein
MILFPLPIHAAPLHPRRRGICFQAHHVTP